MNGSYSRQRRVDVEVNNLRELGALVRERRRHRGLTQSSLAERAGVQRHWVAQLEAGRSNPTLEPLLRTFEVLELQLDVRPLERSGQSEWPTARQNKSSQVQFATRSARPKRRVDLDKILEAHKDR
jgi:transcriptional regulator with XRE-family HTH domain